MASSESPRSPAASRRNAGRRRPASPMAWSHPQRWTVLAASAGSVLATALLLFAGG